MSVSIRDRVLGSLLGGACGDALGAPFEFTPHFEMLLEYGSTSGVRDFWTDGGRLGAIIDDTQLVAFTAAALVTARQNPELREIDHVHLAYLHWHSAHHEPSQLLQAYPNHHRELVDVVKSQGDRVPSVATVESLRDARHLGGRTRSKSPGSGAVTRVAPIGLAYSLYPNWAFELAVDSARLTHGHPSAYLAAGAFAMIIAFVTNGLAFAEAVGRVLIHLQQFPGGDEIYRGIINAPWPKAQNNRDTSWLGYGWTGPEALGIAVNAVMTTDTLEDAIIVACNHDGDSDTTASMAGNLAGAVYGPDLPSRWLDKVEMRSELEALANSLCQIIPSCSRSS